MTIECDLTESDRERCERDPAELRRIARRSGTIT